MDPISGMPAGGLAPGMLPAIPGLSSGGPDPRRAPVLRQPPMPKLRLVPGDAQNVPGGQLYTLLTSESSQDQAKGDTQLRNLLKMTREASLEGRELMERGWWQKLLYINGRQWIYYTPRGGWQDKRLARWIPRPVTNICAETVQTIRAMLCGIEPSLRVRPNGSEPKNVVTAQIADELEPVINEEHQMQTRFFEADFWAPALGVAFLHPHWDRDSDTNQEFIQAMQCPQCGFLAHPLDIEDGTLQGCMECGAPAGLFQPGVDPSLKENEGRIGEWQPIGSGRTDVLSPLEVLIPMYAQRWEDVDRLIRIRWRPKSYYEGRPYANQIQYSTSAGERGLQMYRSLALMNDLTTAPYQMGGAQPSRVEGAIEAELWIKPSTDLPEGLWCRTVGGLHGEAFIIRDPDRGVMPGPLPYRDYKGKTLWPWVYYPYEAIGGRIWARSALDSVLQKQDQLNRGDSMVELIMQRMANPIWLEPKGAEVQRFTGEPGLIVRYQVIAGSQAKPERLEGTNPPSAFFTLREQYLRDIEQLAGTQDVLKGSNPSGVDAFSALQLLVERSQSRFTSLFKARGRAYRDWYAIAIELERTYGPALRTKSVMGQNRVVTFQHFQRAELQGAITVVVEDGSTSPKTSLGKRAALQQGQQMGLVDVTDPGTQYAGLELLGVPEMAPGLDAHTRAAQMEQDAYEQWITSNRGVTAEMPGGTPNPLKVEAWQNHVVHVKQLDIWANADRIRELTMNDPLAAAELTYHRSQHIVAGQNIFGLPATPMQMALPGAPGAPGAPRRDPAPGGAAQAAGAGQALVNSNRESGAIDTLPGHPNSGMGSGPA
jgi:hypothetical protein